MCCVVLGWRMEPRSEDIAEEKKAKRRVRPTPAEQRTMLSFDPNQVIPKINHGELCGSGSEVKEVLVLDMDNTLLEAINISPPDSDEDMYQVHLRPFLKYFLKIASWKYELIIFTLGTRKYAHKVLKLAGLFGEDNYFSERNVFTKEDSTQDTNGRRWKSLQRVVCGDCISRSIAVDDRPEVWYVGNSGAQHQWCVHKAKVEHGSRSAEIRNITQSIKRGRSGDMPEGYLAPRTVLGISPFYYDPNRKHADTCLLFLTAFLMDERW